MIAADVGAWINRNLPKTPAFVYDEALVRRLLDRVQSLRADSGVQVLFALKPFSFAPALELIAMSVDGFAASSLFEARLARETLGVDGSVHITSPGLRPRRDSRDRLDM